MSAINNTDQERVSVDGVAEVYAGPGDSAKVVLTAKPVSATGTGTITARARNSDDFQTIYESDGSTPATIDLSGGDVTKELPGSVVMVKVTSDNAPSDSFALTAHRGP